MRIAVTGASGLVGSALVPLLRQDGHEVVRLVRHASRAADELTWDPPSGHVAAPGLSGTEAVVHLAGAGVADRRWTASYRRQIVSSRVDGTTTISRAMAAARPRPRVLLSASAVGWYGDTGTAVVDETAPAGQGFLADTVRRWEESTAEAADAGIQVVHLRSGLVVSAAGGAWGRRLFPIFRLGVGGRLGSGRQYWSFISAEDHRAAIRFLLTADLAGPVNLTAPEPATNTEVTHAMGRVLHRPTVLPVPAMAVRVALGGFATEVLRSQRVLPRRLLDASFRFRHPDIDRALRAAWAAR